MDDGNDLLDLRAEPHTELQQFGPFCRGRFDPFGQSAAKHAVLGLEILDPSGQAWTFKFTVEEMQRMNSKSG